MDMATHSHMMGRGFLCMSRPSSGTKRIYSAVMKPAFPEEVPAAMPACCRRLATPSATPQSTPPMTRVRPPLGAGLSPERRRMPSMSAMTGRSAIPPMKLRAAVNAQGPM